MSLLSTSSHLVLYIFYLVRCKSIIIPTSSSSSSPLLLVCSLTPITTTISISTTAILIISSSITSCSIGITTISIATPISSPITLAITWTISLTIPLTISLTKTTTSCSLHGTPSTSSTTSTTLTFFTPSRNRFFQFYLTTTKLEGCMLNSHFIGHIFRCNKYKPISFIFICSGTIWIFVFDKLN